VSQILDILNELVNSDLKSPAKRKMIEGDKYYTAKNTEIFKRMSHTEPYSYSNGQIIDNRSFNEYNNIVVSGFLKTLIIQKVNYLLSNEPNIENFPELENVNIKNFLKSSLKEASKKSVCWIYTQIDIDGNIRLQKFPSEEIIAVYDSSTQETIEAIIHYYAIVVKNRQYKDEIVYYAEVYDKEKISYYIQQVEDKKFVEDVETQPKYYLYKKTSSVIAENIEPISLGIVPFTPLYNNEEKLTDLEPIKTHIDIRDIVISDFANNLEEIQQSAIKLIGYNSDNESLSDFMTKLKKYKVLPLDTEGGADYMTMEIPVEAKKTMIELLRKDIFMFGQGVDPDELTKSNITNQQIRSHYSLLDLKSDETESQIMDFMERLKNMINVFNMYLSKPVITGSLKMHFNRSIIINEAEKVQNALQSVNVVSRRTIYERHPWISDIDEEFKRLEAESKLEYLKPNENNTQKPDNSNSNIDDSKPAN